MKFLGYKAFKRILLPVVLMLSVSVLQAQEEPHNQDQGPEEQEEFNIKNFMFGHIANDYDFHITDIGTHKISIPLPIIVHSKERGWFVFMSSKFHHKTESYKGFVVDTEEGPNKDRVMEILPDGTKIRPMDFSITKNVFSIFLAVIVLSVVMLSVKRAYKRNPLKAPSGMQSFMEPVILFVIDDIAKPAIGKGYERYSGYLLTIFFFILTLNIMGLIPVFPFGANVTGNINVTAGLALCTFAVTMFSTGKHYWEHKLWTPGVPVWLKVPLPLMPLVEILSIFTGPIALCIRLFANMLSGHMVVIVLMGMIFVFSSLGSFIDSGVTLISIIFSIFMLLLDVLVSFIQAYVFTLLSALYFGEAKHS